MHLPFRVGRAISEHQLSLPSVVVAPQLRTVRIPQFSVILYHKNIIYDRNGKHIHPHQIGNTQSLTVMARYTTQPFLSLFCFNANF